MPAITQSTTAANDANALTEAVSPKSNELVIGVVGYAGAGCSRASERLQLLLHETGYTAITIKLSSLIADTVVNTPIPAIEDGVKKGITRLERAMTLQDVGDAVRKKYGNGTVAALAVRKIKAERGAKAPGEKKIAFIVDSIKHAAEVELLREVYDTSFRLIAIHCDRTQREQRLAGGNLSEAKYRGADSAKVHRYMDRDERDLTHEYGQQVRDAFYLADFFLDNNTASQNGANLTADLQRFVDLVLGARLVRPTSAERAMHHAYTASLQSSCLSRQVGAALLTASDTIGATGTNDVPRFGGGVYDEQSRPDHRCLKWEWINGDVKYTGCHNDRKKHQLRLQIGEWLADELSSTLATAAHPKSSSGTDLAQKARDEAQVRIRQILQQVDLLKGAPGIKDIIEYSRSIHAEMNALFAAARNGISPVGATLFCTTYPCHNCARHLVTAGIHRVYYIEPYVKSLAVELHSDSIATELPSTAKTGTSINQMVVIPFTGVGPRMYEDFFTKRISLKTPDGRYSPPAGDRPFSAVRLLDLEKVEETAASLVPETLDA